VGLCPLLYLRLSRCTSRGCYGDWCLSKREDLQNRYLAMLDKLMSYCEVHHDYETAILYGLRILSCNRAREYTHRRLMRLYYLSGDRAAALRQYEQCGAALDEELSVKPSKRTFALYKQILTEQLSEPEPPLTTTRAHPALEFSNSSLSEALGHLTQIQEVLAHLHSQVQQSIQKVEQALNNHSNSPSAAKTDEGKDATETLGRRLHGTVEVS